MVFGVTTLVFSWSNPSSSPPGGTLSAPLNTGDTAQTKTGSLTVNGVLTASSTLTVNGTTTLAISGGNVGIGTTAPGYPLTVAGQNVMVGAYASLSRMYSGADTVLGNNVYADTSSRVLKQTNSNYYANWIRMYYNNGITFGTSQALGTAGDTVSNPDGTTNERMIITNAGNVGIGTVGPEMKLHISDTTAVTTFTGDNNQGIRIDNDLVADHYSLLGFGGYSGYPRNLAQIGAKATGSGSYLQFGTSNNYTTGITNTAMTIDYSGNVGIGTTVPGYRLDTKYEDTATNSVSDVINITHTTTGTQAAGFGGALVFSNERSYDGSVVSSAKIAGVTEGTDGPGGLAFWTRYDTGSPGWSERVRIDKNGNVGIGTTGPTDELTVGTFSGGNLSLSGTLTGYAAKTYPTLKTNGQCIYFDAAATYTGYICYNGGFTDASDERLKTNITTVGNALDKLSQIKGVTFNWKDGRDNERHMGVLAQDVEKVAPELVSQPEGIDTKGVFYGGLNALTIEAIKEQQTQIASLSGQLAGISLTDTDDIQITKSEILNSKSETNSNVQNFKYQLSNAAGEIINRIGAFAELIAANIKAGLITAQEITSKKIIVEKATIGKLELIDQVTGETYCVGIKNGEWFKEKGNCK